MNKQTPSVALVAVAFLAVYLIWGSTYLVIRYAIETLPPFYMAGTRFILAGALLFAWTRWRGLPMPTRIHWRSAVIVGGLMLMGGNGIVTWAEQYIVSSVAAVLVATVPLWIGLFEWLRPSGKYPGHQVVLGLLLGFSGVVLLIGPSNISGSSSDQLIGMIAVVFATMFWASGSLYSREAPLPDAPLTSVSMEMLGGGAVLMVLGFLSGETAKLDLGGVSLTSLAALGYLVIFGSMIAFTAYIWLLKNVPPARAATYAYVNPVIAVFLGWSIGNETITSLMLVAASMIIGSVVMITTYRQKQLPEPDTMMDEVIELQPILVQE